MSDQNTTDEQLIQQEVPDIKDFDPNNIDTSNRKKLFCPDLRVILNYLFSEIHKKIGSLKIGIFTVFMVVMVIVMLESVISITPILFVSLGQQEAGAIDFQLTYALSNMKNGNVNYYAVNPFSVDPNNNFTTLPGAAPGTLGATQTYGGYTVTQYNDNAQVTLPDGQNINFLKFAYYNGKLGNLGGFEGFTPRSIWPNIHIGANGKNATNIFLIIDSKQEQLIGLAPQFTPYIIGQDEVILSTGILDYFGLEVGDKVTQYTYINLATPQAQATFQLMGMLTGQSPKDQAPLQTLFKSSQSTNDQQEFTWTVAASYSNSAGKFPAAYGNVVITDCEYMFPMLLNAAETSIEPMKTTDPVNYWAAHAFLALTRTELEASNTTFCQYGMLIDGILANQASYYMDDYDTITKTIMSKAAVIQNAMTLQANATIAAPLMKQFKTSSLIAQFLSSIMTVVIVFLAILSSQLLYSLMLSDVDQKTYEYGMLRALGFKEGHLMSLITIQSFFYSVPGVCCGLVVAVIVNMIFRFLIYYFASNALSFWVTSAAVIFGVIFGLIMPLLAIILPVKEALGKNLRNSLDLNHRQNNEKSVTAQRLEDIGLSLNQTIVGLMLLILGFVTYYCVPLTFFYQKMQWFFFIFDMLLVLIILGMTFMSILIFEYVERGFLWVTMRTCCRRDLRLETLVDKNLEGHRNRNSKTSIMFTLAMSFLIFAASGFQVINTMISSSVSMFFGADIYVNSNVSTQTTNTFLDQGPLDQFLLEQQEFDYTISGWGFTSTTMNNFMYQASDNRLNTLSVGDLSGYYNTDPETYSVPEYFLDVINSDFYYPASIQPDVYYPKLANGKPDTVYLLFSNESMNNYPSNSTDYFNITTTSVPGSNTNKTNFTQEIQILLPAGMKPLMSQDAGEVASLCQTTNLNECQYKYRAKIRAYLTKLPGFLFSGFKQVVMLNPQIVMSEIQYAGIMNDFFTLGSLYQSRWNNLTQNYTFYNGVPKQALFINLHPNCTASRREFIINGMRPFFKSELAFVVDTVTILESLKSMNQAFTFFVGLIGFISLVLTFFLLMVATTQNIRDNIWEYGVLRSMGVTQDEGKRVYMYEAFLVIVSAGVIGLLIGIIVACLITSQFYMFLELPFKFDFPSYLTLMLGVTALITTYVAVKVPITQVNKKQIAVVLKSGA